MSDQKNDSDPPPENDSADGDSKEEVKETAIRRFDPEALLTDDGAERGEDDAIYVDDMYGDWFLDYASYVIL